jgi:hypothetical protein
VQPNPLWPASLDRVFPFEGGGFYRAGRTVSTPAVSFLQRLCDQARSRVPCAALDRVFPFEGGGFYRAVRSVSSVLLWDRPSSANQNDWKSETCIFPQFIE